MASILAIDYGEKRVGLALASRDARLASPYKTLEKPDSLLADLKNIIEQEAVDQIIVGLPRNLEGEDTAQTARCRQFAASLEELGVPVDMIDEAGTSYLAREELNSSGKPYTKGDIDMLAACYILQDYLALQEKV